jgi:hypothetical protein
MKCPTCDQEGAYIGFTTVECLNRSCRHFVPSRESFLDVFERILALGEGEEIDVRGPMQVQAMEEALRTVEGLAKAVGITAKEWKQKWMNVEGLGKICQSYMLDPAYQDH